jgi:hypothetical protein
LDGDGDGNGSTIGKWTVSTLATVEISSLDISLLYDALLLEAPVGVAALALALTLALALALALALVPVGGGVYP